MEGKMTYYQDHPPRFWMTKREWEQYRKLPDVWSWGSPCWL